MAFMILFSVELVVVLLLYIKTKDRYEGIDDLPEEEFRLKKLLPIGIFLVEEVVKYKFDKEKDRKNLGKLEQIYGPGRARIYLRLNIAHNVAILILGICLVTFISGAMKINNSLNVEENPHAVVLKDGKLTRPNFGEGTKEVELKGKYEYGKLEENVSYSVVVGEQIPDDKGCVDYALKNLEQIVLNDNVDSKHITKDLRLVSKLGNVEVKVDWEIEENPYINMEGSLIRPENGKGNKKVSLKAIVSKGKISKEKIINLTILEKKPMTAEEEMEFAKKAGSENFETMNSDRRDSKVYLPQKIKNVKISWDYADQKDNSAEMTFVFGIVVLLLIVALKDKELDEKIKKRREAIQMDYPELLNKVIILLNSGSNMTTALQTAVNDYMRQYSKNKRRRVLYDELGIMVTDLENGEAFSEALNGFANRCKTKEIRKFAVILEVDRGKGDSKTVPSLKEQLFEAWETRKMLAKRRGEEASTKLIMPLMLMLLGILIIVITPAAMSLGGM